ncbi:MAG: PEP-CTERM sorting domain-containing protein [Azoarcus sp.]|nr:PEP-CTERM sorting domain-containing protein [Azoarcus sp.]
MAITLCAAAIALLPTTAQATSIFTATTVIDYYDTYGSTHPWKDLTTGPLMSLDSFSEVLDGNANTYITLSQDWYITLGFVGGVVIDAPGQNDLFISEYGLDYEAANVYISSDWGQTFTLLGQADGDTRSAFDFASIGYTDAVNAVKIVSAYSGRNHWGFDLAYVQGLEGSVQAVPEPESYALFLAGLGLMSLVVRRRRKNI